jgi:NAD(P)-dependent dehydrogenase (short-subunit alcohol dehydrogenase family)
MLFRPCVSIEVGDECDRRGRASLVTGGTGGIGRDVALQLARAGDRVIFVGRSARRGARVLEELREARPEVDHAFLPGDLALLSEDGACC